MILIVELCEKYVIDSNKWNIILCFWVHELANALLMVQYLWMHIIHNSQEYNFKVFLHVTKFHAKFLRLNKL